jgi:hypothetical protein
MSRYENGASTKDIAWAACCSEGSVENYTKRCFKAVLSLYGQFIQKLMQAEKKIEKK